MRGTQLRNTDYILGVAAYTGQDTKMSQNSKINANKFSSVERTLNFCFMAYLCLLLVEVILCLSFEAGFSLEADTGGDGGGGGHASRPQHWYLTARPQSMQSVLSDGVSYLILFSYIIPASLYVTLEVQRVVNSMFIIWDQDLRGPDGTPAMVNCSDLNEELGQVSCHWLISGHVTTVTVSYWPDQSAVHGQDGDADRERDGVQGGLHRGPDVLRGRAAGAEAAALLLRRRGRPRAPRGHGH